MVGDQLLVLFLDYVLRVILRHALIDSGYKTNNRVWPRVTHIDTNEHGSLPCDGIRELHLVKISSCLAVDLLQHVRSLGHIELDGIPYRDDLRWNAILHQCLLDLLVSFLVLEDEHSRLWMLELAILLGHHKLKDLLLNLLLIVLILQLYESGIFDLDSKTTRGLLKVIVDHVCSIEVASTLSFRRVLIDQHPVAFSQINWLINRQLSELLLRAVDDLPVAYELWSCQYSILQAVRSVAYFDAPFSNRFLLH
jgi:hypothetical protein